jgi:PAS domain S-box-containing protein
MIYRLATTLREPLMTTAGATPGLTADLRAPEIIGEAVIVLVLLAGGILLYRTFRERYLVAMVAGGIGYLVYRFSESILPLEQSGRLALSHAAFAVAVVGFLVAVLYYTHHPNRVRTALVVGVLLLVAGLLRGFAWPEHDIFGMALTVAYALVSFTAALHLLLWNSGQRGPGSFLVAAALVLLHMDEAPIVAHALQIDLLTDFLLGLGMVVIVLEDLRRRTRRLEVVRSLGSAISDSHDVLPILDTALAELKTLLGSKCAWVRLVERDQLVLAAQLDLPASYVSERASLPAAGSISESVIREGKPAVIRLAGAAEEQRRRLQAYGFDHVVILPLRGKTAVLGTLALAGARRRSYSPGELEFLETAARQLGIAVENLRLISELMRSQRQWASTFDSIQDLILVHDAGYRVVRVNQAMLRRIGKRQSEVVQQTCEQVLPNAGAWTGCPYCKRRSRADEAPDPCFGGFSMVSTSSYIEDGKGLGAIHMIRDTTGVREAQEKYKMLFEQVQEGIFVSTPEGRLADCNDAFVRLLGYGSREELLAMDAGSLYADPTQRETFRRVMERDGFVRNYEVTLRRGDGSLLTALETSFATRGAEGHIAQYQGFLLDVTEKKRAEEELRRRNYELYALNTIALIATQSFDLDEILDVSLREVLDLFAADTGAVFLIDRERNVVRRHAGHGYRSSLGERMQELPLSGALLELAADPRIDFLRPRHLQQLPAAIGEFVRAEGLQSWLWVIMRSKQRPIGLLAVSSREARDFTPSQENLLLAIGHQLASTVENITLYEQTRRAYDELNRAQEQLLQSEKMAAVGQLISGVAHELNNPLTAILGYAQLLENEDLAPRQREFLEKLYRQAQRTHRVVQNLLSFSRQRKPEKQEVDLAQVVRETLALRDYDFVVNNIKVACDFAPGLPRVVADAHQLEQVFLNIVNNAADAMLEKDKSGTLSVGVFAEDDSVVAEFRDTGPGIREPHRIFDPFYTTKGVGKGTGLGLSICYGIVKEHAGQLTATNHPEGGAVFRVAIPAAASAKAAAVPAAAPGPGRLEARILVVDDEQAVLDLELQALTAAGAGVASASSATAALTLLERENFDAVLLDAKMSGTFTSADLLQWIATHRPGLQKRVLLAVTSTQDPATRRFLQQHGLAGIAKPFQAADLVSAFHRLLQVVQAPTRP